MFAISVPHGHIMGHVQMISNVLDVLFSLFYDHDLSHSCGPVNVQIGC